MRFDSQRRRLAAASALVATMIAFVPISGLVFGSGDGPSAQAATVEGLRAAELVGGADIQEALKRLEEASRPDGAELPAYFAEEIGLLEGARDVRVSANGQVVGYLVDAPCEEAFLRVRAHMAEQGWSEVSLGAAEGATFVKDGGACTWALATCTQAGSATGVVFRCVTR